MPEIYSFVNSQVQSYSYLKSNLQLGKNSSAKFDMLNVHIINTVVLPGEIVIIGDNSTPSCTAEEAFYMKMASDTHSALMANGAQHDGFLVENHELLIKMLGYSSLGIGSVGDAWSKHLEGIKRTLEEIDVVHNDHLRSGTSQSRDAFYSKRKLLFGKLDDQLKSFASYGSGLRNQGSIKSMLGISTKSYLHTGVIAGYAETISGVAKASNLIKKGTYIGMGLDVAATASSIYTACSNGREADCRKSKYVEGGKLSGSLLGGVFGGPVGAGVATFGCAVAFGIVTGGAGALACAVIGGGLGGWAGGEIGGSTGEWAGEVIYEHTAR
ncbi:hypothetical protein C1886_06985 [Pseudomonas sp. FW300-N1A1]|uniref:hypothetical protein n=1 Tax=Pseudomonas sp. FW300-N1A1 TaxID=2075555 RepID=UPI000CD32DE5|nr:hypothetical protein [Pseudomonas sp. FW300-N1A1]POA20909.1 hypothetical protein C1886_06985 [Pseudomonas sp. FW300-N1A1]